jgi:hypothetical protein
MHVGACIAINAKGGDCWQIFNRHERMYKYLTERMLVIDGKYKIIDGMSTMKMA